MSTERSAEEIVDDLVFKFHGNILELALSNPGGHPNPKEDAQDVIWEAVQYCLSRRVTTRYAKKYIGISSVGRPLPITNLEVVDLVVQLIALSITPADK